MSRVATEILQVMAANGTELAYERGSLYLGNRRIPKGKAVLMELIHSMKLRRISMGCDCETEYYRIASDAPQAQEQPK